MTLKIREIAMNASLVTQCRECLCEIIINKDDKYATCPNCGKTQLIEDEEIRYASHNRMPCKKLVFNIHMPSELSAGLRGFTDTVTIFVESGDPGGVPGEFEEHCKEMLQEWYDGAGIELEE